MIGILGFLYKVIRRPLVFWAKKNAQRNMDQNKDILVFISKPDYSDNSRAFSEFLVSHGYTKKYRICWFVADSHKYKSMYGNSEVDFFDSANRFGEFSLSANKVLTCAKYFFGTHGFPISVSSMKEWQHAIMLWHGCSFKDMSPLANQTFFEKALVAGPIFIETKKKYWQTTDNRLIAKGYPRYDWLLHKTELAKKYVNECKKKCGKLIIWMPTFRNDKNGKYNECDSISQFPLMPDQSAWNQLDFYCKEKNVMLVVKLHLFQKEYDVDFSGLKNITILCNEDFENAQISLYEFLAVTDALLTDYSSVGIDYLVVNKPIGFTLDDFELYRESRGFVFDDPRIYMPGHHLYKKEDLLKFIDDIANGRDVFAEQRMKMRNLAIYASKNYSKEIFDELKL